MIKCWSYLQAENPSQAVTAPQSVAASQAETASQAVAASSKPTADQPPPLEQRTRRSRDKPADVKSEAAHHTTEHDDLEFLDSLDKPALAEKEDVLQQGVGEASPGVVPVKIIQEEEKKDLEDWLDDFLGD